MPAQRLTDRSGTRGFSLVEVLCAVAVLSIALLASFKLINQQTRVAAGLDERVFAHWVALNTLEEQRLGTGSSTGGRENLGGIDWRVDIAEGPGPVGLTRLVIEVSSEGRAGARMVGYLSPPPEPDNP